MRFATAAGRGIRFAGILLTGITIGSAATVALPASAADPVGPTMPDDASTYIGTSHMPMLPVLGPRRVLLVIGTWSNGTGPDVEKVRGQVFSSDPRSLRSFVRAASGNRLELNEYRTLVADFGSRPQGNCGTDDMYARARTAIAAQGINESAYDNLYVVVLCQGGANAKVPGNMAMFFGVGDSSHAWLHEYGHNLGVSHPSSYVGCPRTGDVVRAPAGCREASLGDSGDPVGGGRVLYPAITRAFTGWLQQGQFAEIVAGGVYAINPLGTSGPVLYTIRVPGRDRYITLEYRKPDPVYGFAADDNRTKGLWIRYSTVSGSVKNVQLNADPGDASLSRPTLLPGMTLVDETAGVRIGTCSADASGAVFAVALDGQELPSCTSTPAPPAVTVPAAGAAVPTTPLVAGTGVPGATINVVKSGEVDAVLATAQVDAAGRWQAVLTPGLPEGSHAVTSQQTLAGRVSDWSSSRAFVTVKTEMNAPAIASPCMACRTSRYPVVSGLALPGATIQVAPASDPNDVYGEAIADGDGNWSIKVVRPLPDGSTSVAARQTLAGRSSAWSASRTFNVRHEMLVPVIQVPAQNASVPRSDIRVSGTGSPGAIVVVVPRGRPQELLGSTTVTADGSWEVRLPADLPTGRMAVSSRSWDNGAFSWFSANREFVVIDGK